MSNQGSKNSELSSVSDSPPEKGELEGVMQNKDLSYITPPNLPFSGEGFPPICSIAKREEEIFIPGNKDPIMFDK